MTYVDDVCCRTGANEEVYGYERTLTGVIFLPVGGQWRVTVKDRVPI